MSPADEREAARRLAAVLDGADAADPDLAATARVLRDAAAAVRFDVPEADLERALEHARPAPAARPARRRLRPAVAVLAAAVVLAAAILLALPFGSGPVTVDVQARALDALGRRGDVLSVAEAVSPGPGGSFPASLRTGWIEVGGARQRWTQSTADGTIVAETLVDHGRVTRYDPAAHSAVVAASCTALASGCTDAVDPIAFYRRALAAAGPLRTHAVTQDGRRVYRVSLPVQRLGVVRIVQVATIDAATYRPLRIAWRELRPAGGARTFAVIVVRSVTVNDAAQLGPGVLDLELPPGTAITQLTAPGVPVRLLATRRLGLSQARALEPPPWWLGRAYRGHRLTRIDLLRYTGGTAVRMRYGPVTVWSYGRVIPPPLLGAREPAKTIPVAGGVARFYATRSGILIGERSTPAGTVAVRAAGNGDAFTAITKARPLG
jgi:hypothetical protein